MKLLIHRAGRSKVVVRREDEGVEIVDDWNGFGQQLTASGTAYFHDVLVDEGKRPLNPIPIFNSI